MWYSVMTATVSHATPSMKWTPNSHARFLSRRGFSERVIIAECHDDAVYRFRTQGLTSNVPQSAIMNISFASLYSSKAIPSDINIASRMNMIRPSRRRTEIDHGRMAQQRFLCDEHVLRRSVLGLCSSFAWWTFLTFQFTLYSRLQLLTSSQTQVTPFAC